MARPRNFDEERALDAALRAFWTGGYEATSTQDLCEATGLGRSSIYNTFTSKHDLFRRALARYMSVMNARQAAVLDDTARPPADRLRALLDSIVETETGIGCLTVNTTVELAGRDPEIAAVLDRDNAHRLAVLRDVVAAGQRDGTVTRDREAGDLARFLNAVISGIRISSQGGADRAALTAIAATALDALRPPRA
ncbi:TetR/AcrR family transcriptional regulator [Streptomyces sp. RFCAC02]|uniref:TetR/AcrR family transcriptional regulator n=1 Tax=Streptomyces sp. RFCAC02 TaxID=2499143 RepID=UPI0010226628|nr:TetR/AcrR family transcriptional regulator [Streptomyces sp. RFCAC02]